MAAVSHTILFFNVFHSKIRTLKTKAITLLCPMLLKKTLTLLETEALCRLVTAQMAKEIQHPRKAKSPDFL